VHSRHGHPRERHRVSSEVYVPITATLDFERVALRLTVPCRSVRAPKPTTITGPDGQPIVGEGPRVTEGGRGDVLAALAVLGAGRIRRQLTGLGRWPVLQRQVLSSPERSREAGLRIAHRAFSVP
jgi:hypothetical protein